MGETVLPYLNQNQIMNLKGVIFAVDCFFLLNKEDILATLCSVSIVNDSSVKLELIITVANLAFFFC